MTFPYRGETKELNDITRKEATSGTFVQLSDGVTHYELGGVSPLLKGDGPGVRSPVVLVHGFSVPYFIFDPTFDFLTQNGFHALRYDSFGRGFSDRPRVAYNIDLYVRQLKDLLDALRFTRPVDLIGLSMGGPITAAFIARYPKRVNKHVLIDPSGVRQVQLSILLKAAIVPGIGETMIGLFGSDNMVKSAASDFFDPALVEAFQQRYKIQMQYHGFKRSVLSTMRNGMLGSFYETYQRVGKLNKPTLLFWGENDETVPVEHSRDLLQAIPHAEFHLIKGCGHIPHYEKPDVVNPTLEEFLNR